MNRKQLAPTLILLGLAALIAVPIVRAKNGAQPIQVEAYTASPRALAQSRSFVGTLRAQHRVELGAGAFGRVSAVHVRPGQMVHAGDVLFEIDTAQLQADTEAASADVRSANAQLQKLRLQQLAAAENLSRGETLAQRGVLGAVEVKQLRMRLQEAQADFDYARERREQSRQIQAKAQAGLRQAKVSAPISGTVLSVEVEPGEYVAAVGGYQQGNLVALASLDQMEAEILIPEADIATVAVGQRVQLHRATPGAGVLQGQIKEVLAAPASQETLASARLAREEVLYPAIVAILALPASETLLPGMSLRAEVQLASTQVQLIIPMQAVLAADANQPKSSVWLLQGGRAQRREIELGAAEGTWQAVLSGLQAGDQVIVGPSTKLAGLREGMPVEVAHVGG